MENASKLEIESLTERPEGSAIGSARVAMTNISQRREMWKKLKAGKVSGSEICTAAGLNKYETPLQLWARKCGLIDEKIESDQMWLGTKLQTTLADFFVKKTDLRVDLCDELWISEEHPWACVSPDLLWWDPFTPDSFGLGELKTSGSWAAPEWGEDKCPDAARMQIIWGMGITGGALTQGYVIGLLDGRANKFFYPRVNFDNDIWQYMLELGRDFVEKVEKKIQPKASARDEDLLDKIIQKKETPVELNPNEAEVLFRAYDEAKEYYDLCQYKAKVAKEAIDDVKAQFRALTNGAAVGTWNDRKVMITERRRAGYTVQPASWVEVKVK